MKKLLFPVIFLLIMFFVACEKPEVQKNDPYLSLTTDMECKDRLPGTKGNDPTSDRTCVDYYYDGDSILTLKHWNAGFNCCPEDLLVEMSVSGDTLRIIEKDQEQLCRCNCLYDLEIKVHSLSPGKYTILFVEPFVLDPKPALVFKVDLESQPSGKYCQLRDYYPWHE